MKSGVQCQTPARIVWGWVDYFSLCQISNMKSVVFVAFVDVTLCHHNFLLRSESASVTSISLDKDRCWREFLEVEKQTNWRNEFKCQRWSWSTVRFWLEPSSGDKPAGLYGKTSRRKNQQSGFVIMVTHMHASETSLWPRWSRIWPGVCGWCSSLVKLDNSSLPLPYLPCLTRLVACAIISNR